MAVRTGNQVLLAKVDFPKSVLLRKRDGVLASYCKGILDLGNEYLDSLMTYNIAAAEILDLETQIKRYVQSLPEHRIMVSEGKAANKKLKDLIAKADVLLTEQLNKLMVRYQSLKPDFYAGYVNSRKVVDYGIRHNKPDNGEKPPENPQ